MKDVLDTLHDHANLKPEVFEENKKVILAEKLVLYGGFQNIFQLSGDMSVQLDSQLFKKFLSETHLA